jgi:hypothetical protein
MLSRLWWFVRAHVETVRQYQTAVTTAEALIWHHGCKGLDAALKAAEAPTGQLREDVRAELVAKLAADRYLCFKARRPCRAGNAARALEPAPRPDDPRCRGSGAGHRPCVRLRRPRRQVTTLTQIAV